MKEYRRYAVGVFLLIVAIVLIVVGFNLVKNLFKNDQGSQQAETARKVNLLDAAGSNKPVRYTIRGNVVGDKEYRSIRITVDSATRKIEILRGYSDQVLKEQELPNTPQAYQAFLAAINGGGFTNAVGAQGRGSEAQSCPLGRKFNYEVAPGTENSFRSWSTSCGRQLGTFSGNNTLIQTLFQRQIPGYTNYVTGIKLSS